ncbi:hypothetical protein BkAM31D_05795 [Halalkalibacter krulwichiae]|uniref:Uncharacterized protein n=2 Tax=Halalkalibacter krulwichiae TaxID=199441 RepID=A0A1X9MG31_9BACI|nr:hypothetical protein BkAM31D_05795 [Halalkalibacter krulwichiae]
MFRGNKPVLILPGILMLIMFVGGYQFLNGSDPITNEELQNVMSTDVDVAETVEGLQIKASWDWTVMPVEGLYGEDYIGIYVVDPATEAVRTDIEIEDAHLELHYSDTVIENDEGVIVDNGVIFAFSNKLVEHESFGNLGQVSAKIKGDHLSVSDIRIHLLHTWTEHAPLEKVDATFQDPNFTGAANVPHWIRTFE